MIINRRRSQWRPTVVVNGVWERKHAAGYASAACGRRSARVHARVHVRACMCAGGRATHIAGLVDAGALPHLADVDHALHAASHAMQLYEAAVLHDPLHDARVAATARKETGGSEGGGGCSLGEYEGRMSGPSRGAERWVGTPGGAS